MCQSLELEELGRTLVPRTHTADEPSDARFTHGNAGAQTQRSVGAVDLALVELLLLLLAEMTMARRIVLGRDSAG